MLKILPQSTDKILGVKAAGQLSHEDYESFIPLIDAKVQNGEHLYLYIDITDFEGLSAHALVDDFLASMKYWWDFEAVAVVGNKTWEKYFTKFGNYLTPADVRFFAPQDFKDAWAWLDSE